MKGIDMNTKDNYSRAGRASAKVFSYIIDRADKINQILKDKQYKRYLDQDYFEKEDKDSFDDSKDLIYEDIFDKNYKDHYAELLGQQKVKYFKYIKSCAFNKKFIREDKKDISPNKKYNKINITKDNKNKDKKYIQLDNSPNRNYLYRKLAYSQSFEKMLGRYDKEEKKKIIEKKLAPFRKKRCKKEEKKKNQKPDLDKKEDKEEEKEEKEEKEEEDEKDKSHKKQVVNNPSSLNMDTMLERGNLPKHHDVRIRTTKGIEFKNQSPLFFRQLSSLSVLNDKKRLSFNNNRLFSSLNTTHKNNLLINENKKFFDEKINPISKRMFSGLSSAKDIKKIKDISFTSNIFLDKSPKKELIFTPEFRSMKRNFSSSDFNNTRKNINPDKNFSYTFNSKSKTNINFHENKTRNRHFKLISPKNQTHNSAVSFKKMLSRDYVNRIQINAKIGSGMPLTPNYSYVFPKVVMSVKYSTKSNYNRKPQFREICGINVEEKKKEGISQKINFSKMFGRGNINHEFPVFMDYINSRNAFDFVTVKSLKMNHSSKRRFNNPTSSFNNKKSFNINISNNNINIMRDSVKNIKEMKEKENRIRLYNKNIKNIFKKVDYDDIIDKNDITEDMFDVKKNPELIKTINSSYKNLMNDYYKLNLDYLDKNFGKKKIDGITFQEIKSKNKIGSKNYNNPYKIEESEIKK